MFTFSCSKERRDADGVEFQPGAVIATLRAEDESDRVGNADADAKRRHVMR
jgi:hypothetical protein